jgi:two-component system, NarL family, nitrate/nitrite response regulator NarL
VGGPIRVVLVDDEPKLLLALCALFELDDRVEVVATATDGLTAISVANELQPDAIVLDLHLPDVDGLSAALMCRESLPKSTIILCSGDDVGLKRARAAGFHHTLLKGDISRELLDAVVTARSGQPVREAGS